MFRTTHMTVLITMLAFTPKAAADIINVPADQPAIQDAIKTAVDGDEIIVAPGTYDEIIDLLGKAITVRSSDGAEVTIVDATLAPDPGTGTPVARFDSGEDADTVLEGFTLTGGGGDTSAFGLPLGGGVYIGQSTPTIRDCIIENNTAANGGGVFINESVPILEGCTIRTNTATSSRAGGVYLFDAGITMKQCAVTENTAENGGGGMYVDTDSLPITIIDTLFEDNVAQNGSGGAIDAPGMESPFEIIGCTFRGNQCGFVGGAMDLSTNGSTIRVVNSAFYDNASPDFGGGVEVSASSGESVTFANCAFVGNSAVSGGALALGSSGGSLVVANCSFAKNDASDGAAIRTSIGSVSEDITIVNGVFWGNTGSDPIVAGGIPLNFPTVNFSIVEGGWAGPGSDNLDADPLFMDVANDDLTLLPGSPAIDTGDTPTVGALLGALDLAGDPRLQDDPTTADSGVSVIGLTVDRGAYEFNAAPSDSLVGAVCINGVCVQISEEAAIALSATYFGDGSLCDSVTCDPPCPSDLDGDDTVGAADLAQLLGAWGLCE